MFLPFVLSYIFFAAVLFVFINILATSVDPVLISDAAPLSLFLVPSSTFFDVFSFANVFFDISFFENISSFFVSDNSFLGNCYTDYRQHRPRHTPAYMFLRWLGKTIMTHG